MNIYRAIGKKYPNDVEACLDYSNIMKACGNHEAALHELNRGLEIDPNNYKLLCNKGLVLTEIARQHEAIPVLKEALKANPKDAFTWNNLGNGYCATRQFKKALGVNLQQCRNIINYDLPWNPMRLVQRHGRIDRIGSPHSDVFLRCFFPDKRLDALLNLENRIRRKLAQAAASIGVESEVIPDGATKEVVFTETRKEIEALRQEDADLLETAGEDPHAHSGEEYRQELRKGMQTREQEIKQLPWAAGSGIAAGPQRGHFFCARVGERLFLRFVSSEGGNVIRNTLQCLRAITCSDDSPRHLPPDLAEATYAAWEKTRQDIYDEWIFSTDPANLQPRIRPFFRQAAEHLRKYPPADVSQSELDMTVEALEAPWGVRIERAIKEVFRLDDEDPVAASKALVWKVRELGLQPFIQPEPLPVIDEDDIALICWMVVDSKGETFKSTPTAAGQ